ncbi:NAD(P)/FAD-dependent oxidoreductase [Streptomyces sp. NPDC090022]|uniref:NAD(P)/FAD-dependent oxidoreductase n=1 Tax=Streptomyces sp. NPDC090022 TaxID=3365920 RepID=UPI0037F3B075
MTHDQPRPPRSAVTRAVVLGGGLAGLLTVAAVLGHVDEVVVVERHPFPEGPQPHRGVPQARHGHVLWSGGADAMEALLPGVQERWKAGGAHRIGIPTGMVSYSTQGWYRRWDTATHYLIGASRALLDHGVRAQLLAAPGRGTTVRFLEGAEPLRLLGDARRVDGVLLRRSDGTEEVLGAQLVVDATGRGSRAPQWLAGLGIPAVPETVVDAGVTYATRDYRPPAGAEVDFPVVNVQADPRAPHPGRVSTIIPIEGGRWRVCLSATRGAALDADPDAFETAARAARSDLVGEFLARAEPVSEVSVAKNTVNRRRHFERLRRTPDGFVVVGDALAAFNPVYGHGMSVAALGPLALRGVLEKSGDVRSPGFTRRAQKAVAGWADAAWILSAGQDVFFPGATGRRPNAVDRLLSRYVDRLVLTATGDHVVVEALTDVMTLQKKGQRLVRPTVVWHALRGPGMRPPAGPVLTSRERDLLRGVGGPVTDAQPESV